MIAESQKMQVADATMCPHRFLPAAKSGVCTSHAGLLLDVCADNFASETCVELAIYTFLSFDITSLRLQCPCKVSIVH